jgi:Domain of unknown function (DUF4157)
MKKYTSQPERGKQGLDIGLPHPLPHWLRWGIEILSGLSMRDVKVFFNSSKPKQFEAHAYTLGADIHIAPGQERLLSHEAWHVVQQKQGRVEPTMKMKGFSLNDDSSLEKEADVMGARAEWIPIRALFKGISWENFNSNRFSILGRKLQMKQLDPNQAVIQRTKFLSHHSTTKESPLGALVRQLPGINDFYLSPTSPTNIIQDTDPQYTPAYERPDQVKAEITGTRRTPGTRLPDSLTAIIGNLGNQELLIAHGDRGQVFAGGHLIGDQLLPNALNSFEDWNLAPQNVLFNAPVYEQIIEREVFKGSMDPSANRDTKTKVILTVDLTYKPNDVSVMAADLVTSGVVDQADLDGVLPPATVNQATYPISFPRRVPETWDMKVDVDSSSPNTLPEHKLTPQQKSFFSGTAASTTLGPKDFGFHVSAANYLTSGTDIYIGGSNTLTFTGTQGEPSFTNPNPSGSPIVTSGAAAVKPKVAYLKKAFYINREINKLTTGHLPDPAIDEIATTKPEYTKAFAKELSKAIKNYIFHNMAGTVRATTFHGKNDLLKKVPESKFSGSLKTYYRKFLEDLNVDYT